MKVLGICCSPRKGSNTEVMLQAALGKAREAGAEVELVTLSGKTISPCDACCACLKTGKCHIKDDMQDIYPKLREADGIILGSPIYFWNVTAQAKALIDRTFALYHQSELINKAGGAIIVTQRSGHANGIAMLNSFFSLQKMLSVGWADGTSGDNSYTDKEAIKEDTKGMGRAEVLGKKIVAYILTHQIPG